MNPFSQCNEIIGVRIRIPDHPDLQQFWTPPCLALSVLLTKTMALMMEKSGHAATVSFAGALPVIHGIVTTDDFESTVKLLRETFVAFGLECFVQWYRFDDRELVFRPLDPSNVEAFSFEGLLTTLQTLKANYARLISRHAGQQD